MAAPNTQNVFNYHSIQHNVDSNTAGITDYGNGQLVSMVFNDVATSNGNPLILVGGNLMELPLGDVSDDLSVAGTLSVTGASTLTGIVAVNGGTNTAGSAHVITPTLANGTAAQLSDLTRDYMLYLEVGTAGTAFVLKIGPTSTPATTVSASGTATTGQVYTVRVPAGWYVEWSATTATLANQTAISC
jgi:hypothetical protein